MDRNKDVPELLPCPFCGGDARWDCMTANEQNECTEWSPECAKCGGTIILDRPAGKCQAAAAWNNRPITAEIAELRAQLDEAMEALDKCRCIIKFHVKNAGVCCTKGGEVFSALDAHNAAAEALAKHGDAK